MDEQLVRVRKLENDIYEFTALSNSRATVDAFFRQLSQAMQGYPKTQTFRYLVDISKSALPPFAYFVGKNRAWVAANPEIAPTRVVVLLPNTNPFRSFVFSLVTSIMRGARSPLTVSVFAPDERDKAIFWLLADS